MDLEEVVNRLHKLHHNKTGYMSFCVIEFAIAFGMFFVALRSGNLFEWLICAAMLFGGIRNLFRLIESFTHGIFKKSATR